MSYIIPSPDPLTAPVKLSPDNEPVFIIVKYALVYSEFHALYKR